MKLKQYGREYIRKKRDYIIRYNVSNTVQLYYDHVRRLNIDRKAFSFRMVDFFLEHSKSFLSSYSETTMTNTQTRLLPAHSITVFFFAKILIH